MAKTVNRHAVVNDFQLIECSLKLTPLRTFILGDSGGGLTLEIENKTKSVVGIVSFGAESGCEKNYPTVMTFITPYLEWIKSHIEYPKLPSLTPSLRWWEKNIVDERELRIKIISSFTAAVFFVVAAATALWNVGLYDDFFVCRSNFSNPIALNVAIFEWKTTIERKSGTIELRLKLDSEASHDDLVYYNLNESPSF